MTLERYFLGQCLWDTSIPINTKVKPEDFETSYARDIFIAMLQLINEGKVIDEATLSEHTKLPLSHFLKLKDLESTDAIRPEDRRKPYQWIMVPCQP